LLQFFLDVRVTSQVIDGVGNCRRGGVMGRKHQEDGLVGDFFLGKVVTVLVFFPAEETQHVFAVTCAFLVDHAAKELLQEFLTFHSVVIDKTGQVDRENVHDAIYRIEESFIQLANPLAFVIGFTRENLRSDHQQEILDVHKEGNGLVYIFFPLVRSEEHTSELQSRENLVCRLLLEK